MATDAVWRMSPTMWAIRSKLAGANVVMRTGGGSSHLQFGCFNRCAKPVLGPDLYRVFCNAVNGNATADMEKNPGACSGEAVAGHCGHKRGELAECRCEVLDRFTHPKRREAFENQVIETLLSKIPEGSSIRLNLTIFATGKLLGEEVLLFKLLNELSKVNANIQLHVSLIDTCYADAIATGSPCKALGILKDLNQFLDELSRCKPGNVALKGTVFKHSDDYVNATRLDPELKHDLIVGADIEGHAGLVAGIDRLARKGPLEPIVLVKEGSVPKVCTVAYGKLAECYVPADA